MSTIKVKPRMREEETNFEPPKPSVAKPKINMEELKQVIASAPPLPPTPPDIIQFLEHRFRPQYEEFLRKLRKLVDELP